MSLDDVPRVQRIKEYVLARLGEELAGAPRGAQAQLAKKLGVSGAHLSNMLSRSPSRQPGEDFRRKVAAHWGLSYGQLEAAALGEDAPAPASTMKPAAYVEERADAPSLAAVLADYAWMPELPLHLRRVVEEQARQHLPFGGFDYTQDDWQRIVTGLEREALALLARRPSRVSGMMARVVAPSAAPKKPAREG